jgi:hypothetical protein
MAWNQAKAVLIERVIPLMREPANGTTWIINLENEASCKDGRRLGVCMAIDVLSGALEPKVFASVLDMVDQDEIDARRAFGIAFDKFPDKESLVCVSNLVAPPLEADDFYMRILLLRDFIEYYVSPNNPHSFDPADVEDVRLSYFGENAPSDLSDIETWWTGLNGVVWVMSHSEYVALTSGMQPNERGTILNDALGLGKGPSRAVNDGVELVAVRYPNSFTHACSQPSTLDAYWVNYSWYYLSYTKEDGWGRTQSCSGTAGAIRERVHRGFEGLSADFSGLHVGGITNVTEAREKLLTEGYRRLTSILPAS